MEPPGAAGARLPPSASQSRRCGPFPRLHRGGLPTITDEFVLFVGWEGGLFPRPGNGEPPACPLLLLSGTSMLSQTVEYALRAATYLATSPDEPRTVDLIAEATLVPVAYLAEVMRAPVRGRIVTSRRGVGGGFTLVRSPRELRILEIVQAVDPIRRHRTKRSSSPSRVSSRRRSARAIPAPSPSTTTSTSALCGRGKWWRCRWLIPPWGRSSTRWSRCRGSGAL